MKNKILEFITQKKNALKQVGTEKPISGLSEKEQSKSVANNKVQNMPDKEGDSPGQVVGIGKGIQKAPWMQETRTNEFGRPEAKWGLGKHDWMVQIPAGEFMMGAVSQEKLQHKVRITKPFWLMKYPVTQKQWVSVMGNNPSYFKGDDLPVEMITWDDAQSYIKKLNERAGEARYRLPTASEWEYACRAGSTGEYCFGDDETQLDKYAWYSKNSEGQTHPVGQKKPNAWGLYDVHGNVWEWVSDWHGEYPSGPVTDPSGPTSGSCRALRGGSWRYNSSNLQVSSRYYVGLRYSSDFFGIRCAQD